MRQENIIAEEQLNSPHYLKNVTELGDTRPIHTTRDIYSANGVKLLNADAIVNSSVYERLLNHRLIPNLDESLATEGGVSNQTLIDDATYQMGFDAHLKMMREAMPNEGMLTDILARIPLNPSVAFKLTVMRTKHPELFQRSIYITLVSIYLGIQERLAEPELTQLATAALLHDIGILHIDPTILDRAHHMTEAERRHLYAHPLTAWLILREFDEYSDQVTEAVLQHHERLDGSGYPRGLRGHEIGEMGQIIALAEIIASSYGKEDAHHGLRLGTILKLNSRRYGRHLVGHLKVFYDKEEEIPAITEEDKQLIRKRLSAISAVLEQWESRRNDCPPGRLCDFINDRMKSLKVEVLDAGLNPYEPDRNILDLEDDPRAGAEAKVLLDETIWQVRGILREIRRRWFGAEETSLPSDLHKVSDWISEVEGVLN
jgi:HD-GYP domain-containing protein (c-di-GMP phosphodiesterase class II)